MTRIFPPDLRLLHSGLIAAAKELPWHPSHDARIHHGATDRGKPDPKINWYPYVEESVRVVPCADWILHLQCRLEAHPAGGKRVILFGRRVKSLSHITPNTQRATFNSDKREPSGFYLRSRLDEGQAQELARLFDGRRFPRMAGKVILLGDGSPKALFRRFLSALIALETVKDPATPTGATALLKEFDDAETEFDSEDLAGAILITEGKLSKVPISRRTRCQHLLVQAQTYFSHRSPDGRLRCDVCRWAAPLPTRRQIVQIHHHRRQISDYPTQGLRLTLHQALSNLVPLCPNCHSVHESKPDGGRYELEDLKSAISSSSA